MEDTSDILGGQLNIARHDTRQSWSEITPTRVLFFILITTLLAFAAHVSYPYYRQFQEKRYRKSMRRRYGIPDNDLRPFSVAFAAAKHAQQDRESKQRNLARGAAMSKANLQSAAVQRHLSARHQNVSVMSKTQRAAGEGALLPARQPNYLDSGRTSGNMATPSESDYPIIVNRNKDQNRNVYGSTTYPPIVARRAVNPKDCVEPLPPSLRFKHTLDHDAETAQEQEPKKTKVEGDELIDGDEEAGWHESDYEMEVEEVSPAEGVRSLKHLTEQDEDEGFESSRAIGNDKRARKVSRSKGGEHRHGSSAGVRGKKRDRAEAGSSLGGDEQVVTEDEDGRPRVLRRRRVVSHRKSNGHARGQKRGREVQSTDSDDETSDSPSKRAARHKRGKRSTQEGDSTDEEAMISQDPLCGGRRVGEEWETGGIKYKVGPNGQRLREVLLKKTRSRFPMPKDSEHPDRDVNIDVFVESWLSEEEYQIAKERQELAWQQSPKIETTELAAPEIPESPSKGKNLLWASTSQKDLLAPRRIVPRQPLVHTGNMRINPFSQSQVAPVRRISTVHSIISIMPDSPKLRPSKSYSKWEKQDLEAAAMAKLREKVKQEAVPEPEKKPMLSAPTVRFAMAPPASVVADSKPATIANAAPTPAPTPAAVPVPVPAPAPAPASAPSAPAFSFGKLPTATAPLAPAAKPDLPSLTIPSASVKVPEATKPSTVPFPSFGAPSQSVESLKTAPAPVPAPSQFSFGKPTAPVIVNAAQPSAVNNAPSFFARPSVPAAALAPAPTPSTGQFPAAAQPASSSQLRPSPFSTGFPTATQVPEEKPAGPTSNSSSLLTRMGGFGSSTQPQPASMNPPPAASTAVPSFFSKPPTAATPAAPATSGLPAAPMKFDFGIGATNATTGPAPAEANKPATGGAFSFNPPAAPSFNPPAAPSFNPPAAPSFNPPAAPSFANPASSNATTEPPKFAFAFGAGPSNGTSSSTPFGNSAATQNAPATAAAAPAPSPFGNTSSAAQNGTAATQPMFTFGAGSAFPSTPAPNNASHPFARTASTTPAAPPPSTSFFGNANSTAAPAFGNPAASATTPAAPTPFGNTAAPPSTFGATPFGSTTPAGKPPTSSMFGNGAGSAMFGQGSTTPAGTPAPAKDSNKFTFGPVGGSTTPAGAPPLKFTFGAPSANATAGAAAGTKPTPSAFGFGGPSRFTFGKPADSTQK